MPPKFPPLGFRHLFGGAIRWLGFLGFAMPALTVRGDEPEVWMAGIQLDGMSLRSGQVCWKHDYVTPVLSRIQRRPSGGGPVRTPYFPTTGEATRVWSRTAESDKFLNTYWASRGGQILSPGADANAPAAVPSMLCDMESPGLLQSATLTTAAHTGA